MISVGHHSKAPHAANRTDAINTATDSKDSLSLSKFVASGDKKGIGIGGGSGDDDSKTPNVKGLALPEWSILQVEPLPASLRDHAA